MVTNTRAQLVDSDQNDWRSEQAASKYDPFPIFSRKRRDYYNVDHVDYDGDLASGGSLAKDAKMVGEDTQSCSSSHAQPDVGINVEPFSKLRTRDSNFAKSPDTAPFQVSKNNPLKTPKALLHKDDLSSRDNPQPSNSISLPLRNKEDVPDFKYIGSQFGDADVQTRGERGKGKDQRSSQLYHSTSSSASNKGSNSLKRPRMERSGGDARDNNGHDEDDDGDGEQDGTPIKDKEKKRKLVCPFAKYDPTNCDKLCFDPIDSTSRLRQHYHRKHFFIRCHKGCGAEFRGSGARMERALHYEEASCTPAPSQGPDCDVSEEKQAILNEPKSRGQSEDHYWSDSYYVLFGMRFGGTPYWESRDDLTRQYDYRVTEPRIRESLRSCVSPENLEQAVAAAMQAIEAARTSRNLPASTTDTSVEPRDVFSASSDLYGQHQQYTSHVGTSAQEPPWSSAARRRSTRTADAETYHNPNDQLHIATAREHDNYYSIPGTLNNDDSAMTTDEQSRSMPPPLPHDTCPYGRMPGVGDDEACFNESSRNVPEYGDIDFSDYIADNPILPDPDRDQTPSSGRTPEYGFGSDYSKL